MTTDQRAQLRALYRDACFGAGADVRRLARTQIDLLLLEAGTELGPAFRDNGLDLNAYWATRPI